MLMILPARALRIGARRPGARRSSWTSAHIDHEAPDIGGRFVKLPCAFARALSDMLTRMSTAPASWRMRSNSGHDRTLVDAVHRDRQHRPAVGTHRRGRRPAGRPHRVEQRSPGAFLRQAQRAGPANSRAAP